MEQITPHVTGAAESNPNLGREHTALEDLMKRIFDICLSGLGLMLLSPVFLYLPWRIKRDSPGPAFYRGLRTGKSGKDFLILKFRTMFENSESTQGARITAQGDERITSYGQWLRTTKLNELPQLWNVFIGQMSLVGPRPEDHTIVDEWPPDAREEILSVRPGITSPASVLYNDEEDRLSKERLMQSYFEDILPSKLRLDQLYVRYRSFWGDLDILFYTMLLLLPRLKLASPPEEKLLVGPITLAIRRNLSWFTIDILITFLAIAASGLLWRSSGPLDVGLVTAILFGISYALIFSMISWLFGLQRIAWSKSSGTDALDLLPAVVLATIIILLVNQYVLMADPQKSYRVIISIWNNQPLMPIAMILTASALAFVGFIVTRFRERLVIGVATRWIALRGSANPAQERALIIGGGQTGQYASLMLNNGFYRNTLKVVGFVDDDLYKMDTRIQGLNVVGRCRDIPELVNKYDIGIIIFAIHNIDRTSRQKIFEVCAQTTAQTFYFPDIPAALTGFLGAKTAKKKVQASDNFIEPDSRILSLDAPCQMCLSRLSPLQVDTWLSKIEKTAKQGDVPSVLEQIHEVRKALRDRSGQESTLEFVVQDDSEIIF